MNNSTASAANTLIRHVMRTPPTSPEITAAAYTLVTASYKKLGAGLRPSEVEAWATQTTEVGDDLADMLTRAGWTPPTNVTALLAAELDQRLLGTGEGDTSPVYVLIEQSGSMVIGVEKRTYDECAAAGELGELFDDRPADVLDTVYTVLGAEQIAAARAVKDKD